MKAADGRNALTTTAVVMVELFKVTACLMEIQYRRHGNGGAVAYCPALFGRVCM